MRLSSTALAESAAAARLHRSVVLAATRRLPPVAERSKNARQFYSSSVSQTRPSKFNNKLASKPSSIIRSLSSSSLSSAAKNGETKSQQEFDVLIVGGGVVGAALARLLSKHHHSSALTIGLIEAGDGPPSQTKNVVDPPSKDRIPHPRSYALSPASLEILGLLNDEHRQLQQQFFGYYDSMQVWEAGQPASLLMNATDLKQPDQSATSSPPPSSSSSSRFLGCCVEDSVLQSYLWSELDNCSNVTIFPKTVLKDFQLPGSGETVVRGSLTDTPPRSGGSKSKPSDERNPETSRFVQTRLLVAADGGNSQIRKHAGIEMASFDYGQTALTFTVELQRPIMRLPQQRRAYQRFLSTGPLALLPTYSDQHCVVVWSTTPDQVQRWKQADPVDLAFHLNDLFSTGPQQLPFLFQSQSPATGEPSLWSNLMYGVDKVINTVQYGTAMAAQQDIFNDDNGAVFQAPPVISNIVSPRFSFPLSCQLPVRRYTTGNNSLALIGDAAHTVHPMAGQGLNLGLQDVAALARVIDKAVSSGMDVTTFVGSEYERSRHTQVGMTVAGIHGLQRMFGGQSAVSKHMKSLGMSLIQNVGPVRRALVQAACHGVAVPRTLDRAPTQVDEYM